jgi:hypothetical protein
MSRYMHSLGINRACKDTFEIHLETLNVYPSGYMQATIGAQIMTPISTERPAICPLGERELWWCLFSYDSEHFPDIISHRQHLLH